ncbi:hypothetical protein MCOR25_002086 [Pyricularia grisea]|uniref:SHSP domain-containing protein n=1 Tax=Pyricularia grisea TaxID=148305 RepID=A0A6P8BD65_PYRGI|nr:uncharacterized protein PgNI_03164 [Pyricularia grisea]KAI6379106.1 hypothetical protein MCOR25_002086 [Pyricularia grisea]TLD13775.1 hypothetical protein PgNI_03164 [Pyricularia grisea]
MSFFRNSIYDDSDVSFAPVFRFIDAFDNFQRAAGTNNGDKDVASKPKAGNNNNNATTTTTTPTAGRPLLRRPIAASFNPRFDVIETKDAYELHGEIPGAKREDVTIEFTEPQTIVIRGRVERSWSSDDEAKDSENDNNNKEKHESHKATVSDEDEEEARENGRQVTKSSDAKKEVAQQQQQQPTNRYWVQERSIGEFSRTFTFPVRVDEANVKAALNHGVLKVTVPKQEKPANRRIDIL